MNKNIFKELYKKYYEKGLVVLPDKYGDKKFALKDLSTLNPKLDDSKLDEIANKLKESNIALVLGKVSGVVAIDVDTDRDEYLDPIRHLIPDSPVEKKGAKGFTRFYRYSNENSETLKVNGEMVLELLSDGKKSTLPPSLHPNGGNYIWTSEKTLLDIDINKLPILPPAMISHMQLVLSSKFPDSKVKEYGRVITGRNQLLSVELGNLLNENLSIETTLNKLIEIDKEKNNPAYFTDPNEHRSTDAVTNAMNFYASHLVSVNSRRYREGKEYLTPVLEVKQAVEVEEKPQPKKLKAQQVKKLKSQEFLRVPSALKQTYETILKNSWIPQPELAMGAVLSLFSTLTSRKFVFQGISPNLYILNISKSGTGKDYVQQFVKQTIDEIGANSLLGAGDYVSDAALVDSLRGQPVRLDIMDEAGGILKTVNSGKSEYNGKMADILAELYTSSNSRFLGRAKAEGVVGATNRPNVNILASTTPTGFKEGVTRTAIDKGLLGRFLIFQGDSDVRSVRIKKLAELDINTEQHLQWLKSYNPEESELTLKGNKQEVTELKADKEADKRLDEIFEEFDDLRIECQEKPSAPIIARLYQQMIKLIIIHACSREFRTVPTIALSDVEFGYNMIKKYQYEIDEIISNQIFNSKEEKERHSLLQVISSNGILDRKDLILKTPELNKQKRDNMISELVDGGLVKTCYINKNGTNVLSYYTEK